MSTKVEKRILVNVPVSTAYNQWTQFEDFPQFMGGIKSVTQLSDDRLEWVAEIGGIRRQWEARILEQVPDRKVSWAATEGATNAGSVTFEDLGGSQTSVTLFLEYEPEGLVEKVGDKLNVVEKQAEGDLERFKAFIESEGYASGAWRGSVNEGGAVGTPGVEHAAESRGDSGKAGVSGKVVAGAVGLAAAAAVGVAAAGRSKDSDTEVDQTATPVTTTPVTGTVTAPAGVASDDVADRDVSSPFDQTNGLADVDGESDGTAQSDTTSAADRLPDRGDDPLRGDRPIR
ncbi:SRPBCC family protein [Arthrobacter zhaoguopingii]|uniref:SRPBCC family protein n=1 Tax=Arthrobacter zhaoguopingii TaxID=2681491 RepID=UPI00135CC1B9|nr:SRPBCC family protein [Arthrobacter zhaoguopingii]